MSFNKTAALTVNGTQNLLALLIAAGYQGPAHLLIGGSLYNTDAAVEAYLHFTDSNVNPPGVKQVESTPVVGTITTAGNGTFTITGDPLTGSPLAVSVPLTVGQVNDEICRVAARTLTTNVAVNAFYGGAYEVSYNGNILILTRKTPAANDGTLNIAYADDTCVGLTPDASSDNTTAGSLATTSGMPFGPASPGNSWDLPAGTDLSTIWLHTASSISIKAEVQG